MSQPLNSVKKNVVVMAGQKVGNSHPLEKNVDSAHLASMRQLNDDLMNGPAQRQRTDKEKMVLLQKQLLEIQRKQSQCLLKLKQEKEKVRRLERDSQRNKINPDSLNLTKEQVIAGAKQFMAEPALSLFSDQLDFRESQGLGKKSMVWSLETRRFAQDLYQQNATAYRFLENAFHLPDISEIQSWVGNGMDCDVNKKN